jgi:hypothetical protein
MTFAAPLYLLALLPWAAVVAYLVWGRRRRVDVPFLALWPSRDEGAVRVRRRATPPPLALALAILAMLLGILAAGRPAVRLSRERTAVTLVIDRGWSMSAAGVLPGRHPLFDALGGQLGSVQQLEVWTVPASGDAPIRTDASDLTGAAVRDAARPTAVDTRNAVPAAVRKRLGNTNGPVIVVSDPRVALDDNGERLVWISPEPPARNAGIVSLSVREFPAAQAMVRVRATPGLSRGTVRVSSGAASAAREVELAAGRDVNVFLDLPKLDAVVKAELLVDGPEDRAADNVAWVVRESSWPRIESRVPLPAHLQRMVEVYARQRPADDGSRRVILTSTLDDLRGGNEPAVVFPPMGASSSGGGTPGEKIELADHPLTRNVTCAEVGWPALAASEPPAGWAPVVRAGGKVWVAVREQPIRAVWVGFDAADWARSTDYVVFWANVFNWLGGGGSGGGAGEPERFAAHPVGTLDGDWTAVELAPSVAPPEPKLWPGLYRRADGTPRALCPPELPGVADARPPTTDWRERLRRLMAETPAGRAELGPGIALAALVCLAGAAAVWKRRERAADAPPGAA